MKLITSRFYQTVKLYLFQYSSLFVLKKQKFRDATVYGYKVSVGCNSKLNKYFHIIFCPCSILCRHVTLLSSRHTHVFSSYHSKIYFQAYDKCVTVETSTPAMYLDEKYIIFVKTPLSSNNFKLKFLQKFKILDKMPNSE